MRLVPRLALSMAAAILFFGLDTLHVRAGIWKAANADGVPWWYLFVYFLALLVATYVLRTVDRKVGLPPRVNRRFLVLDAGTFVALLVVHLALFRWEVLLAVVSIAVVAARFVWFRRPGDLVVATAVAAIDACVELGMASSHQFAYSHASLGPLPLWLIPFWGGLGLSMRGLFSAAEAIGGETTIARKARP